MKSFLRGLLFYWSRFSLGWCFGVSMQWVANRLLPSDAPKSARFVLMLILTVGALVLGARSIGWIRERAQEWQVKKHAAGQVESCPSVGAEMLLIGGLIAALVVVSVVLWAADKLS